MSDDADGLPIEERRRRVATMLAAGRCPPDHVFDSLMPVWCRPRAGQYFTTVAVAVQAAGWLHRRGARSVVDIGSGAGKFAVLASLTSPLRVVGIQQRPNLVEVSRALACEFGLEERVSFVEGTVGDGAILPVADAYYLFNPFGEHLFEPEHQFDQAVELCVDRFARDVAAVERFLATTLVGTFVICNNGFGGSMPAGYVQREEDRTTPDVLALWERVG